MKKRRSLLVRLVRGLCYFLVYGFLPALILHYVGTGKFDGGLVEFAARMEVPTSVGSLWLPIACSIVVFIAALVTYVRIRRSRRSESWLHSLWRFVVDCYRFLRSQHFAGAALVVAVATPLVVARFLSAHPETWPLMSYSERLALIFGFVGPIGLLIFSVVLYLFHVHLRGLLKESALVSEGADANRRYIASKLDDANGTVQIDALCHAELTNDLERMTRLVARPRVGRLQLLLANPYSVSARTRATSLGSGDGLVQKYFCAMENCSQLDPTCIAGNPDARVLLRCHNRDSDFRMFIIDGDCVLFQSYIPGSSSPFSGPLLEYGVNTPVYRLAKESFNARWSHRDNFILLQDGVASPEQDSRLTRRTLERIWTASVTDVPPPGKGTVKDLHRSLALQLQAQRGMIRSAGSA